MEVWRRFTSFTPRSRAKRAWDRGRVYGGAAGIWVLYDYVKAFFLVEAKFQGGVVAGKLGLGGPLWSEHNGILTLTLGKEREGEH